MNTDTNNTHNTNTHTVEEMDMTEEEAAGMMHIDEADVEYARKVLERHVQANSQAALCPEEYGDGQDDVGPIPLLQGEDYEVVVSEFINLEDRVGRGLVMYLEAKEERQAAFDVYIPLAERIKKAKVHMEAWKGAHGGDVNSWPHWTLFNEVNADRRVAWGACEQTKAKAEKYYQFREELKVEKDEVINTHERRNYLWFLYYQLRGTEFSPYWITSDSEEIDNQVQLYAGMEETIDCLSETHLKEEQEYNKVVKVSWPNRTGGYVPPCRDVTYLYTQEEEVLSEIDQMIMDASRTTSVLPKDLDKQMTDEELASQEAYAPF